MYVYEYIYIKIWTVVTKKTQFRQLITLDIAMVNTSCKDVSIFLLVYFRLADLYLRVVSLN